MEINMTSLVMMLKFAGGMLGILAVVFGLACATPWLAKQVDKLRKKKPEADGESLPDVPGLYDAQTEKSEDAGEENTVKGIYDAHKKEPPGKRE